jgi:ABC-type bacteriocin/lantibiotic exporter with double-glycine peptidase domain
VRRNTLLIDAGIAAVLAIFVLIIAPGLAVVALLAILVVIVCGISFAIDLRRNRSQGPRERPPRAPRTPRPPRSAPPSRRSTPRR